MPSRRQFLASVAALSACAVPESGDSAAAPSPTRGPEPEPWDAPGELDETAFDRGVQVGDATHAAALASVRTTEVSLTFVLVVADGDGWSEVARADVAAETGAQIALEGLEPDTAYTVCAYASDGVRRSRPSRFRTAPEAPGPVGGARVVVFGASSCFGGNAPWPSISHAAAEDLDFFLLLGDTVYADGAQSVEGFRAFWDAALAIDGLLDLSSRTSLVATWDDHEVANDWDVEADATVAAEALQAFREAIPQRLGPGGTGIWRSLRWGDTLELFVLDCRGERSGGDYVSPEQMAWLKDGLASSDARFKIIVNSVPITDFAGTALDAIYADQRWQGYPEQRAEILAFVEDTAIGGVLWVCGDFHFGMLARVGADGARGADAWEVFAGPAGSFLNIAVEGYKDDPDRFPVALGAFNYVRFSADPGAGEITVQWIGDDGTPLAEAVLAV